MATPVGSSAAGAKGLIKCLRSYFGGKGVPRTVSSDGGTEFTAASTKAFLKAWGVEHRVSLAYYPQSNSRAEVAVKAAKRIMMDNVRESGSIDTDNFLRALLTHHNTPDPVTLKSPAEVVFGKLLADALSFSSGLSKYNDDRVRPLWRHTWQQREEANRSRFYSQEARTNEHSRPQRDLKVGERVLVQNGNGNSPKRWERTGVVMERHPHGAYSIRIDGSGRVTQRTRQHLRPILAHDRPDDPPFGEEEPRYGS